MIKLDLRNLTQAHIDEAMPNMGRCYYSAPCIIGTLMSEEDRERFDNENYDLLTPDGHSMDKQPIISELVAQDHVAFAEEAQAELATKLQSAFDSREQDALPRFRTAVAQLNKALGLDLRVPS